MQSENTIKVMTFNLRRDSRHDNENRWKYRRELAAAFIRRSDAAIIGVQELLPSMREDICNLLTGYSIFGEGRNKEMKNEHSDIIINNEKANVRDVETFWLSKTPHIPGSRAYFAVFPRICTVADVYLKDSGRRIRVFNTHFDHICGPARHLGADLILRHMAEFMKNDPTPMILMGDLNARPTSKTVKILLERSKKYGIPLKDAYLEGGAYHDGYVNTHHGFHGKFVNKRKNKSHIDYIFVSSDFEVVETKVDYYKEAGRYPSDHYPLTAVLRLK